MSDKNKPEESYEIDVERLKELCDLLDKEAYPKSRKLGSIPREFNGGDRELLEKLDGFDKNTLEYMAIKLRLEIEQTYLSGGGGEGTVISIYALLASSYALIVNILPKDDDVLSSCIIIGMALILFIGGMFVLWQNRGLCRPRQVLALLEYAIKLKAQESTKSAHDESA